MAGDAGRRIEGGLRIRGKKKTSVPGNPLISIVTVVYNGERHLEQTIRSVIGQTHDNVEYLIVDGGSTDVTLDIMRMFEDRIDYWVSEPDQGIYDAMNKGIGMARGELIGLLNADDYYDPDALRMVAGAYLSHRRLPAIYYGDTYILQEDLDIRYKSHASIDFWRGMSVSHQAMFIHSSVYEKLGRYSVRYRLGSDYDFVLRAVEKNVPFIPVGGFLVHYRNSGLSARDMWLSLDEGSRVHRSHYPLLSIASLKFNARLLRSALLLVLQRIIRTLFGERSFLRIKKYYFRKFISKGSEY